ncbi:MAG: FliM/FliN family flagellar motor switch protein [Planctomycetales bacterium]|nr:FliM/FliN family flagellar motor switch protein [Planctomycetales bacterium]
MSELTPQLAAEVVAACTAGAEEAAGALGRSLDGEFTLAVGEPGAYSAAAPPDGCDGPGLTVMFSFAGVGVAALLPESSGLLPEWYADPDPTGASKLSTLAQELSMLLVPDTLMADVFEAQRVDNLTAALARAGVADDAALVPLTLASGETTATLSLVWPLATPDALFPAAADEPAAASAAESPAPSPRPQAAAASKAPAPHASPEISAKAAHTQSLMRVRVPLSVALASKKETVQEIVELAPGTIIKFNKSCDELLHLYAGGQPIAEGEAVKVGEKFGFRVSAMLMPQERFVTIKLPNRAAG